MSLNQKIENLSQAAALTGTEVVPVVQAGITVKTTTQDIADLAQGGGGGLQLLESVITINAERMATIYSNPLELIPSPGAGKYIDPYYFIFETYGGTIFFQGFSLRISYKDFEQSYFASSVINFGNAVYKSAFFNQSMRVDKPLMATSSSTNPNIGDGYVIVRVIYRIVTTQ